MALPPLADVSDLPQAWQADPNAARAIEVASAAIRDAAGAPITGDTSTVTIPGGSSSILPLAGPVTSVASVLVDGDEVADYEILSTGLWSAAGWGWAPVPVTVTYTYGLTEVPADITDLCVQLATSWLQHQAAGGGSTAGLTAVRLDDASESYSAESSGQVTPVYIPSATRSWLAARFGGGPAVVELL